MGCQLICIGTTGSFVFSFMLVMLLIPVVIRMSVAFSLYDEVDLHRKQQVKQVSRLGGFAIFAGLMSTVLLFSGIERQTDLLCFLASSLLLFCLGMNDDICRAGPFLKSMIQVMAAVVLVFYGAYGWEVNLRFLGPAWKNEIPGQLISVLLFVLLSNAFNLIDGSDGLAAVLGVFANLFFGFFLFKGGDVVYAQIAFAMAGALSGFLIYNVPPAKIFMGDAGAMVLGLVSGLMANRFTMLSDFKNLELLDFKSIPAIAFAVLIIPVFDCIRLFLLRLAKGKSPFIGDRNHIHHRLKQLGWGDRQVLAALLLFNCGLVAFVLLFGQLGSFMLVSLLLAICILFNGLLTCMLRKKWVKDTG